MERGRAFTTISAMLMDTLIVKCFTLINVRAPNTWIFSFYGCGKVKLSIGRLLSILHSCVLLHFFWDLVITANQSESWLEDSSDFQDLPISYYNKTFILTNLKFIFAFTYFARKSFRSEQSRANERLIRLVPNRQLRYKINTICPLSNSCPLLRQLVVKKKITTKLSHPMTKTKIPPLQRSSSCMSNL